jgi:hypothetical protein
MNILSSFAQASSQYNYPTDTTNSAESAAFFFVFFMLFLVMSAIFYALLSFCLMRIFKKSGVKQWIAWVPIYNTWKMLEIGGQKGYWAVLAFIPVINFVSIVFIYIAMYHISVKLGKDGAFVLLAIFLPYVWYVWLAFDASTWNDSASTAPSIA